METIIHSGYFSSSSSSPLLLRDTPDYSIDTLSDLYAEAQQATASKVLTQSDRSLRGG